MTHYTLLRALTSIDGLRRSRLDRLACRVGPPASVECFAHPSARLDSFGGPLTDTEPLEDQIEALLDSGLWPGAQVLPLETEAGYEIQLWPASRERAAWSASIEHSLSVPAAAEVMAAASDLKVATWVRDQKHQRLERALWAADDATPEAYSRPDLIPMSGLSRGTVYKILRERPDGFDGPAAVRDLASERVTARPEPAAPAVQGPTGGGSESAQPSARSAGQPSGPVPGDVAAAMDSRQGGGTQGEPTREEPKRPGPVEGPEDREDRGAGDAAHRSAAGESVLVRRRRVVAAAQAEATGRAEAGADGTTAGGVLVSLGGRDPRDPVTDQISRKASREAATSRRAFNTKSAERFSGIAAAMDEDWLYLPDGTRQRWEVTHLGEIAMLGTAHRLGWGGGERMPDRGEVWLYPGALERLGLPVFLDSNDEGIGRQERNQAVAAELKTLNAVPAVAEALAAGWSLGEHDRLQVRTRIYSETDKGVFLVAPSWMPTAASIPLLTDLYPASAFTDDSDEDDAGEQGGTDDGEVEMVRDVVDPPVLVQRLQMWVEWLRAPFRISPAATGLAIIDHTNPPRRSRYEDPSSLAAGPRSKTSKQVTVVRGERPDLPDFKAGSHPRFNAIEGNFSWWRPFESLMEGERRRYVHAYDHRSHYLGPWGSTELGVEGLVYRAGVDAMWDGSEAPAYFLVDQWSWDDWSMPDPGGASSAFVQSPDPDTGRPGMRWVTSHTLRQLERLQPGFTDSLTFHESYTWAVKNAYLKKAGVLLREARNVGPEEIRDTVKATYAGATGKMHELGARSDYHLHRPDWTDMIQGAARTSVVAALIDIRRRSEMTPLAVVRDTIIYACDTPDAWAAWPGNPDKLESIRGGWRPIGSGVLDRWGPGALPRRGNGVVSWQYERNMNALTAPAEFAAGER